MKRMIALILLSLLITSCANHQYFAPIYSSHSLYRHAGGQVYVVRPHDTLFSIALRYDTDFRKLAQINHIQSPYTVKVGQALYLQPPTQRHSTHPSDSKQRAAIQHRQVVRRYPVSVLKQTQRPASTPISSRIQWVWPVRGRVIKTFAPNANRKGIDIAGRQGDHVKAAASGIVAYAGSGLPGYGNLIIIKHENNLLTAYSHLEKNLVQEGRYVKAGQIIANIGMIDRRFYGLHFEIRRAGRPVNPSQYLNF